MTDAPRATKPPLLRFTPAIGWPETVRQTAILAGASSIRLGTAGAAAIAVNEPFGTFGGRRSPRGLAFGPGGMVFLADPLRDVVLALAVLRNEPAARTLFFHDYREFAREDFVFATVGNCDARQVFFHLLVPST